MKIYKRIQIVFTDGDIPFNTDKFTCMKFVDTCCKHQFPPPYKLDDLDLSISSTHKNLGLIISDDLSWSSHYAKIVAKAHF